MTSSKEVDFASAVEFEDVAAGHDGILVDPSGLLIYKPCTSAEIDFYQSTVSEHVELARLMPTFMGTLQRGKSEQIQQILSHGQAVGHSCAPQSMILPTPDLHLEQVTAITTDESIPLKGKKLDTDLVLVLENVLAGFKRPNVMDVKLGKRLWADDAPPAKRAKFDDIASKTTSGSLSFRVAGMRIWEESSDPQQTGQDGAEGQYKIFDKMYGRSLTEENVGDAFKKLLCLETDDTTKEYVEDIIHDVDRSVEEIESVLVSGESRMYSASLLIVFEGDSQTRRALIDAAVTRAVQQSENRPEQVDNNDDHDHDDDDEDEDEDEEEEEPRLFDVRLIDFAHAAWTPGQGKDENMLLGIANVRNILKSLLESKGQIT